MKSDTKTLYRAILFTGVYTRPSDTKTLLQGKSVYKIYTRSPLFKFDTRVRHRANQFIILTPGAPDTNSVYSQNRFTEVESGWRGH